MQPSQEHQNKVVSELKLAQSTRSVVDRAYHIGRASVYDELSQNPHPEQEYKNLLRTLHTLDKLNSRGWNVLVIENIVLVLVELAKSCGWI